MLSSSQNISLTPEEQYIKQIMNLLDEYATYYKDKEKYINALCHAFFNRNVKINVDKAVDDHLLMIKRLMDEALKGDNALLASVAIAKKLEQICYSTSSIVFMVRYISNRQESLQDIIIWMYQQTLKNNKDWIGSGLRLMLHEKRDLKKIHKVLNLFRIEKFKIEYLPKLPEEQEKWDEFLSILSNMKSVDFVYNRLIGFFKKDMNDLAESLSSARVIRAYHQSHSDVLSTRSKRKMRIYGIHWEIFFTTLLKNSKLIALILNNFDLYYAKLSKEQQASFRQHLASSNILSLDVTPDDPYEPHMPREKKRPNRKHNRK